MSDLIDDFNTDIIAKAKKALGGALHGDLSALQLGSQGDFPWFWSDPNGSFNGSTYDYVTRRAVPGDDAYALPDSFLTAYSALLDDLAFDLSSADQAKLNDVLLKATVQAGTLVSSYQQSYGSITKDDLDEANEALGHPVQKIDYVIEYVVGYLWSGAKSSGKPPMTRQQMAKARHLSQELPDISGDSASTLSALVKYIALTNSVNPLIDASSNAQWLLGQVRGNLEAPDAGNGGMTVVDAQGNTSDAVGYTLQKTPSQILASLQSGSSMKVEMSAYSQSANQLQVDISGRASTVIPLDFLGISVGGGASYSMFEANGSGARATIEMEFEGLTTVGVAPRLFEATSLKGWFHPQILAEAQANQKRDVTGWRFGRAPSYDLSAKGDFGMLANMVVSKFPKITITYEAGDYHEFSEVFEQDSYVGVSLFGIPLGGVQESSYSAHHEASGSSKGFKLTLNPPDASVDVPPLQQRAYVIGAVVEHPGAGGKGVRSLADAAEQATNALMANAAFASTRSLGGERASRGNGAASARAMVRLGGVTFANRTGGPVEIFVGREPGHAHAVQVAPGRTSPALSGTLRTIDVVRPDGRYSYDMSPFWPNGLLVEDESPYALSQVVDEDGETLLLVIRDRDGERVAEVNPAGVMY